MTEPPLSPHSLSMLGAAAVAADSGEAAAAAPPASFEQVYDAYFPYIWRSVQRLGTPAAHVDDVVQEVFIVVHRKLGTFEGRSSVKTWLYGIALRVARAHRLRVRARMESQGTDAEALHAPPATRPDDRAENAEAAKVVNRLLDGLDDDQREVFVLAELEQLTAPEIAETLDVKLNTIYSRLRLAREAFAEAAARHRARDGWRTG